MNPNYIIDGYNLIYNIPRFRNSLDSGLEHARNMLISFVRGYLSSHKVKMTIVFDGDEVGVIEKPSKSALRLKIIYSKPPEKADPIIKRLVRNARNKKSLFVVSADNELIQFGRNSGAQTLSPEEFYQLASKHLTQHQMDQKYNSSVSKEELDDWLKLFGEKS